MDTHTSSNRAAPRPASASSPCTKVCSIDPASRLCLGCGRSIAEIGEWSGMGEERRQAIMAALPARIAQAGLVLAHAPPQNADRRFSPRD